MSNQRHQSANFSVASVCGSNRSREGRGNARIRDRKEKAMATIHDYARMCRSFGGRCSICPLNKLMGYTKNCGGVLFIHASEASAIIDKWCAEHPQKTYLQDFLEKFPKAEKMGNGLPYISPCRLYGEVFKCTVRGCSGCWNAVMPDEADKEEA